MCCNFLIFCVNFFYITGVRIFPVNQQLRIFPSSNAKHVLIDTVCFAFGFSQSPCLFWCLIIFDMMQWLPWTAFLSWFSVLRLQPLQDLRCKIRDDNVSSCPPHATQHLHQSCLQIECTRFGSMIQHGILPRHLINSQWVCWIL